MRFAKQHHDHRIGMALPYLREFMGGVTIARPDFAQSLPAACNPVHRLLRMLAGCDQQFVKRCPVISPIEIETHPLGATQPRRFRAATIRPEYADRARRSFPLPAPQDDRRAECSVPEETQRSVGSWQGVIIADQEQISRARTASFSSSHRMTESIRAKGCAEIPQIFSLAVGIDGADLALHFRQRMQLRG